MIQPTGSQAAICGSRAHEHGHIQRLRFVLFAQGVRDYRANSSQTKSGSGGTAMKVDGQGARVASTAASSCAAHAPGRGAPAISAGTTNKRRTTKQYTDRRWMATQQSHKTRKGHCARCKNEFTLGEARQPRVRQSEFESSRLAKDYLFHVSCEDATHPAADDFVGFADLSADRRATRTTMTSGGGAVPEIDLPRSVILHHTHHWTTSTSWNRIRQR